CNALSKICGHHRNVPMLTAYLGKCVAIRLIGKVADGISTKQREGILLRQIVPELLEPDGGLTVSPTPQDINHLAERQNGLAFSGAQTTFNDPSDMSLE